MIQQRLLVGSNLRVAIQRPKGCPRELQLLNLPHRIHQSLQHVRFVNLEDVTAVERETSEVSIAGKVIQRTGFTRGGQSVQYTLKCHEKRGNDTNMALQTSSMPVSKPMVTHTAFDVSASFDRQAEAGLELMATIHQSKLGMNTLVLAPACMGFNVQAGSRLQSIFDWEAEVAARGSTKSKPLPVNIHHVHVIAPWLSHEWFGGEQKGLYTRGKRIAVTINGLNYVGLWKKPFLYAHEWYCMNHRRNLGVLHAGAIEGILLTGPSALGKTEVAAPLTALREHGKIEFVGKDGVSHFVDVGEDVHATDRRLIVDDMAAFWIDPETGELWIFDAETGHWIRFDQYRKRGDHPIIDMLSVPGCTIPCSWTNVGMDNEGNIIPEKHVTLDGLETDNPRVAVGTISLPSDFYRPTTEAAPAKIEVMVVGIPSAPDVGLPTFSILSNRMFQSLAVAGLRANRGNQSIKQDGDAVWVSEQAYTLVPFGDLTEGETVAWMSDLIQRITPNMLFALVSQRASLCFEQANKYDGMWFLRWLLEHGVEFRNLPLTRHQSMFAGWCPTLPEQFGQHQRLIDPSMVFSAEEIAHHAKQFDTKVLSRLCEVDLDYTLPARQREELRACRAGNFGEPFSMRTEF